MVIGNLERLVSNPIDIPVNQIDDRDSTDPITVKRIRKKIRNNEELPPIELSKYKNKKDNYSYGVEDGYHRIAAHKAEGKETILAQFVKYRKLIKETNMLSFKDFLQEEKKTSGWVDQYGPADEKRIDRANKYLFKRSLRKGSKWDHMGVHYGYDEVGPNKEIQKRKIGIVMTNKEDPKKEVEFTAKPDVERNPGKYKLKRKITKNMN